MLLTPAARHLKSPIKNTNTFEVALFGNTQGLFQNELPACYLQRKTRHGVCRPFALPCSAKLTVASNKECIFHQNFGETPNKVLSGRVCVCVCLTEIRFLRAF